MSSRPRVADDFTAIRARLDDLRQEAEIAAKLRLIESMDKRPVHSPECGIPSLTIAESVLVADAYECASRHNGGCGYDKSKKCLNIGRCFNRSRR